jgi:hypothetical protein
MFQTMGQFELELSNPLNHKGGNAQKSNARGAVCAAIFYGI